MEKSRILALDGARGVAAFCVLLFHVLGSKYIYLSYLYIVVDFFFVLSGFVLAPAVSRIYNYLEAQKFLISRFVRIFPMVFAVITFTAAYDLIIIAKHWLFSEPSSDPIILNIPTFLISILMLQVFYKPAILVNYPIWSLSAEWLVNIFIAFCNIFSTRGKYLSTVFGLCLIITSEVIESELINQIGRAMWGFSIGLVLFEYRDYLNKFRRSTVFIILLVAPIYFFVPVLGDLQAIFSILPFAASILYLSNSTVPRSASKIYSFMGKYSYGFYLWHFPMLSFTGIALNAFNLNTNKIYSVALQISLCSALSIFATKVSMIIFEDTIRNFWLSRAKLI